MNQIVQPWRIGVDIGGTFTDIVLDQRDRFLLRFGLARAQVGRDAEPMMEIQTLPGSRELKLPEIVR